MKKIELPKLYKKGAVEGYEVRAISEYMQKIGKGNAWSRWYIGQTGAVMNSRLIVFKHDVDRFLAGLPDLESL